MRIPRLGCHRDSISVWCLVCCVCSRHQYSIRDPPIQNAHKVIAHEHICVLSCGLSLALRRKLGSVCTARPVELRRFLHAGHHLNGGENSLRSDHSASLSQAIFFKFVRWRRAPPHRGRHGPLTKSQSARAARWSRQRQTCHPAQKSSPSPSGPLASAEGMGPV